MIICCPSCQKRYDIAQYIVAQKEHYKLRCSHCLTLWQLSIPFPLEPEPIPSPAPRSPASQPVSKPRPTSQRPSKKMLSFKTYSAWHDLIKQYSLDWIILLVVVSLTVLLIVYEGKYIREVIRTRFFLTSDVLPQLLPKPTTEPRREAIGQKAVAAATELRIEKASFSMVEQEGQLKFVVKGEIINPSHASVTSPDLQIIARGECPTDLDAAEAERMSSSSFPTPSTSPRCVLAHWVHPMEGQLIPAGGRQSFQAFVPTQKAIKAKEVEITGYMSPQQRRS